MIRQPEWLSQFVDRVLASSAQLGMESGTGCHVYRNTDGEWEVTLFSDEEPTGRMPGLNQIPPALSVDIFELVRVFDELSSCRWQSAPAAWDDDLGVHLAVEGKFEGHAIWLRIVSQMPACLAEQATYASARR
ncbi:MAG: hypothetical protein O2820_25425 [Planctomycetota bacterium]|nr:hypothetical protein [Planctomycetota bacterium]MDA1252557.1 hypothetical protein [Planctomycetota bacterium]